MYVNNYSNYKQKPSQLRLDLLVLSSSYSGGDFIIPRNVGSPWAAEGSTPHVPQRCVITRSVLGGPVVQVGLAEPVGHLPVSVRRICVVVLVCMYPVPISSYSGIPSRYRVEFWLRSVSSNSTCSRVSGSLSEHFVQLGLSSFSMIKR